MKNNNTTKRQNNRTKLFDEYRDMFTLRMVPIPEAFLERLATDLIKWALNDEEALKLSIFFNQKGIGSDSIRRWRERSKVFDNAYCFAKEIIGNRREIGGLKKTYDSGIVASSMPHYDPEWKEMAEWRAKLKQEVDDQKQNITVVLESIPNSPLVKDKK